MAARPHRSGMDVRLRWWAVALPAAAFAALLMLLVSGGDADAATPDERQPVGRLIQHIHDSLMP
ncbi:hypothetical protein [Streptomyces johnsoniae]|uniref:Secreted protein n=1 Tax=Streptomyces johnsoniae TaxID=3075532 RepID=A0ABU2S7B0_9ACTN|nr:hypothetical protein [Streptomyces sp. DSM 41886]MDT0444802.1 hypothetical protein [Streptomyces sp. DSM 41886]